MTKDRIIGVLFFLLLIVCIIIITDKKSNTVTSREAELEAPTQPAPTAPKSLTIDPVSPNPVVSSKENNQSTDFAPRNYMPLKVGNSWTYQWKRGPSPVIHNRTFFLTDTTLRTSFASIQYKTDKTYIETYEIISKEDGKYYFRVNSENSQDLARDGRYDDYKKCYWKWEDDGKNGIAFLKLWEFIIRPEAQYVPITADMDIRDLYFDKRAVMVYSSIFGNTKNSQNTFSQGRLLTVESDFSDHEIVVPAGKFLNCIEAVEIYEQTGEGSDPKTTRWKTFMYFAPKVGKVKEYQQLEDGTIAYTLELESYKVAK